jgi:hypothetical protein
MPYQFQNFCHETIDQAVNDEIDNGLLITPNEIYSPVSYVADIDSAIITYQTNSGGQITLDRVYPACVDIGYPSMTHMTLSDAVEINGAIIGLWVIAYCVRAVRGAL